MVEDDVSLVCAADGFGFMDVVPIWRTLVMVNVNLKVVGHVGRLLDGLDERRTFPVKSDGDIVSLISKCCGRGRLSTTRINKVQRRVDDGVLGVDRQVDADGSHHHQDTMRSVCRLQNCVAPTKRH